MLPKLTQKREIETRLPYSRERANIYFPSIRPCTTHCTLFLEYTVNPTALVTFAINCDQYDRFYDLFITTYVLIYCIC